MFPPFAELRSNNWEIKCCNRLSSLKPRIIHTNQKLVNLLVCRTWAYRKWLGCQTAPLVLGYKLWKLLASYGEAGCQLETAAQSSQTASGGTSNATNYKLTIEGITTRNSTFLSSCKAAKGNHWQNTHDQVQKQMCHNPPNLAQWICTRSEWSVLRP
jgi:hypothetical protein